MIHLLSVTFVLLVMPEQEVDTAVEPDFRGSWRLVSIQNDGETLNETERKAIITADRLNIPSPQVDPPGVWWSYGLRWLGGGKLDILSVSGRTYPAIYKRTEDRLFICWDMSGRERPKDFTAKQGSTHRLVILERKKSCQ